MLATPILEPKLEVDILPTQVDTQALGDEKSPAVGGHMGGVSAKLDSLSGWALGNGDSPWGAEGGI